MNVLIDTKMRLFVRIISLTGGESFSFSLKFRKTASCDKYSAPNCKCYFPIGIFIKSAKRYFFEKFLTLRKIYDKIDVSEADI